MKFDGYDYVILGAALGAGAALLFAKAYFWPSYLVESAGTYLDQNPFQLRNVIISRNEALAGCIWLFASLLVSVLGTVRTVNYGEKGYLVSLWPEIVVLFCFLVVVWRLTLFVTSNSSRAEYVPLLSQIMRDTYAQGVYMVHHDGQYRQEKNSQAQPSDHVRKERLNAAARNLANIGKLLDVPRLPGENDREYSLRLAKHFPGIGHD